MDSDFTQAGHKRLRTTAACVRCRAKKLKCDAQKPSCSLCLKKGQPCQYAGARSQPLNRTPTPAVSHDVEVPRHMAGRLGGAVSSTDGSSMSPPLSAHGMEKRGSNASQAARPGAATGRNGRANSLAANGSSNSQLFTENAQNLPTSQTSVPELPSGQLILPFLDAFLENIHPISCNNFLHPGSLCAGIHKAPELLLLAICGSAAKFMPREHSRASGLVWADQAKALIMKNTAAMSTLTISAIQFLALHEMHDGKYTSAWNLVGEKD